MDVDEKELQQFGMVALVGLILVPGVAWIMRGKTTGSMLRRSVAIAAVLAAAASVEVTIDRTAEGLLGEGNQA